MANILFPVVGELVPALQTRVANISRLLLKKSRDRWLPATLLYIKML